MMTTVSEFDKILDMKQSLIEEKRALDVKSETLERFFRTAAFASMERVSKALMRQQLDAMREYSGVLARRLELMSRGYTP